MKKKISPSLNDRLRKEVKNYNRRLATLNKAGFKNLPEHQKVSEIKSRYKTIAELRKEVERLSRFNSTKLDRIELNENASIAKWQLDFLKTNTKSALEYFQDEYNRVEKKVGRFPGERMYIDTLSAKINILSKDVNELTQPEVRTAIATVTEFSQAPTRLKNGYRGFLNEVEWVMDVLGYPEDTKDIFFKKFNKLTPSQFLYLYDNNDIIGRVYTLYHKDMGDLDARLTIEEEDAAVIIDSLLEQADIMVKEAQTNMA